MGDVLPFGTGAGDNSMNQPVNLGDINEPEEAEKAVPVPTDVATPINPNALNKSIDNLIRKLRIAAQRLVILLPPAAIPQELKQDLFTQYTTLEATAVELKGRVVLASDSPENKAVERDLDHLKLDVQSLTNAVEEQLRKAGSGAAITKSSPISSRTALYIGLGLVVLAAGGAIYWAYTRNED